MWRREFKAYPEVQTQQYVDMVPKGSSAPRRIFLNPIFERIEKAEKEGNNQAAGRMRAQVAELVEAYPVRWICAIVFYAYDNSGPVFDNLLDDFESEEDALTYGRAVVEDKLPQFRKTDDEIEADLAKANQARQNFINVSELSEQELIDAGLISPEEVS